jgi:hypothetical protein
MGNTFSGQDSPLKECDDALEGKHTHVSEIEICYPGACRESEYHSPLQAVWDQPQDWL